MVIEENDGDDVAMARKRQLILHSLLLSISINYYD